MLTRLTWIIGIFVTTVMVILYGTEPRSLVQGRAALLDSYQRAAPRISNPESPIHIVDIDEASLRELGQWPWPRTYLAELSDRLFEMGAAAVGFDILFAEPDRTSPERVIESWSRFSGAPRTVLGSGSELPDHDTVFAEALGLGPTVLAVSGAAEGRPPPLKAGIAYTGRLPERALTVFGGALSPIPQLQEAASGFGGISLVAGSDGITRSVPMIAIYGGVAIPSFSAELLRVAQGAGSHILQTSEASGQISGGAVVPVAMRTGALEYPLDENGHFRIHFSEPVPGRTTSAHLFLKSDADLEALAPRIGGKIVLIGSSAQALFDIRATPLTPELPGVELHAAILDQIINQDFLIRPDWMRGLELLLIVGAGLLVTALAARERPVPGLVGALVSVAALLIGGWFAFIQFGYVLNPFEPALTVLAVYLPATTINVFGKERARRKIRERFGYFLPAEIVNEIAMDPDDKLTPQGAEIELSVMFVDMRGFSTISENMAPEDVVRMLNIYLGSLAEGLVGTGATIDKFMGDAIMAFWNAPLPQPDHIQRSVNAVFAVELAVAKSAAKLKANGLPQVEARIGVNTGPAFVGLMGSSERLNYSCVGDSVTLAARLEALTRTYGTINLVGAETARHVPEGFIAVDIDRVVVKGRRAVETTATVLRRTPETEAYADRVSRMRSAYVAGRWTEARKLAADVAALEVPGLDPARIAGVYQERIDILEGRELPSGWDGNFEALNLPALAVR